VLRASRQPAILNHLYETRAAAIGAATVELEFRGCESCGFVWNCAFDADTTQYEPGYVNDQSCSTAFGSHLRSVEDLLCELAADRRGAILEVGCGQGGLLHRVCERTSRRGIGFDPAFTGATAHDNVTIHAQPFTASSVSMLSGERVSLLYARHVLEHVHDPLSLARLMQSLDASMYLEVPTFAWIAKQRAFYDLFNEHCSLFTQASMIHMLARCGMEIRATMIDLFEGQYLGVIVEESVPENRPARARSLVDFRNIMTQLQDEREWWQEFVHRLCSAGPVLIWGAGAKGVSFLNQLGLNFERMPHVIDINPKKHSKFLPIAGQQVISPGNIRDVCDGTPPTIIIMNPAYQSEIRRTVRQLGLTASFEVINNRRTPLEVPC
jgi:hypothetical protein